jgi:hypothetical protein
MCKTQAPECVVCGDFCYHKAPLKVDIDKAKWYMSIDSSDFIKNNKISISRKEPVWEPFVRDIEVGDVITFGTNGDIEYGATINSCVSRIDNNGSIVFERNISDITKIEKGTYLSGDNYATGTIEEGEYLLGFDSPDYIHTKQCVDCGLYEECDINGYCDVCKEELRIAKYSSW